MKKFALALALLLWSSVAWGQCTGVFQANNVCGTTGTPGVPGPLPLSSFALGPGGISGNVQTNNGAGGFNGITNTQLTALINQFTTLLSGAVPASGGGTVNFLRADGTWAVPPGTTPTPTNLITPTQGRLTLTANAPVMAASATAQTTLRYDCYVGNQVPYYTGTTDAIDTIASCEVTDAMVSAASAGQVVASNVYDVWWVHGGANRICLAMSAAVGGGGGWASDGGSNTARGTGFSVLDGVTRPYVTNKNSITNCFNGTTNYGPVSANQGTYLGTVFASGNGQISFTFGAASSGGTAALLGVWNGYNRVTTCTTVIDSGTSYTYSTNLVRQARASAGNQIQFVLGAPEDGLQVTNSTQSIVPSTVSSAAITGIGFDVTNAFSFPPLIGVSSGTSISVGGSSASSWNPGVGLHTLAATENAPAAGSNTFDAGSANTLSACVRN